MRHLVLLILPAIFGMVYSYSSGEVHLDYDPLKGPPQHPTGQLVQQNHGAIGDPKAAVQGIEKGGPSGERVDYNYYDGPPVNPQGPKVNMQHGAVGAPQVNPQGTGGSSNDDGGAGAVGNAINPPIIPYGDGDDSNDVDYEPVGGAIGGTGGAMGGAGGAAANAGDSSVDVDAGAGAGGSPLAGGNRGNSNNANAAAAPNPAPVAGGADVGTALSQNDLKMTSSAGMSGGAVAGVVAGVVAVAAVGTAVAVVVLRSGSTALSAA